MNLTLRNVIQTSPDGEHFFQLKECYIKGNNIKYLRIAEEIMDKVRDIQYQQRAEGKAMRGISGYRGGRGGRGGGGGDRGGRGGGHNGGGDRGGRGRHSDRGGRSDRGRGGGDRGDRGGDRGDRGRGR